MPRVVSARRTRARDGGWLRGAAAAALVAGASACSFLTAPGSPAPSAFEDASTWNAATLSARTKGQCAFMLTEPYVENFKVKNTTFWAADQFDGAQHCTGLAPSGPSVCTMASSNALTYSYPLYPPAAGTDPLGILSSGDTGLKAVISQSACLEDTSLCKFSGGESYWLGAHMESQGCIQFGVLEITAKLNIPPETGAFFFLATYMEGGATDASWNEIDLGWPSQISPASSVVPGQVDIEYHATLFTSNNSAPTVTTSSSVGFVNATTPGVNNKAGAYATAGGTCSSVTTKTNPSGLPTTGPSSLYNQNFHFNSSFANEWHTYKVVWQQNSITWMVDTTELLTIDYAIWLPQTLRFILRTNTAPCVDDISQTGVKCADVPKSNGGPFTASPAPTLATAKPNGTVYVSEIRWTPLSAASTVVADAKAYRSIGSKCPAGSPGCADPYAAAGVPKPTPSPPPPYATPVAPAAATVTTSSVLITGTCTKATFGATQQTQLATAVADSVKVASSAVKFLNVSDVGAAVVRRRHLAASTSQVEVYFTVSATGETSLALENALAAAWETNQDPEKLLTAAGLTCATDATLNAAPKSEAATVTPPSVGSPADVTAQITGEYIVLAFGLLLVIGVAGSACVSSVRGRNNQKR